MSAPLDARFWPLVEGHFRYLVRTMPVFATFVGIHSEDHRLGDGSRDAVLDRLDHERAFMSALEGLDAAGLSEEARFERDLALHASRLDLFTLGEERTWERRSSALEEIGDAVFSILARDFAPLPDRLGSITARLEGVPTWLREHRSRLTGRPVRLWNEIDLATGAEMPGLFAEVVNAGRREWPEGSQAARRLDAAVARASEAVDAYEEWLRARLADATDDWPLGRERYEQLIRLRALDGLTPDDILAIGEEQLRENREARRRAARDVDRRASEAEVVDRIKNDHPVTFDEALDAYRDAMFRARQHIIDHDLATIPAGERLHVQATPEYLRNASVPFAAYFEPPRFDPQPDGIYVVTPSVGDNPDAMREHNFASISNTSVHEAYPGHHLQLSAAITHPSLVRALVDAPEFCEGWGMYSEQMMREQGFDASPEHMVAMYSDAIWRSCRVVLDVRLHRGDLTVEQATDFLVEQTGFERANAQAEVFRYTYTPTYQLSYLVGKVLLLRLREDERRRLGPDFSLRRFHDQLLYSGSLPISFHRRLLAGEGGGATLSPADLDPTGEAMQARVRTASTGAPGATAPRTEPARTEAGRGASGASAARDGGKIGRAARND